MASVRNEKRKKKQRKTEQNRKTEGERERQKESTNDSSETMHFVSIIMSTTVHVADRMLTKYRKRT